MEEETFIKNEHNVVVRSRRDKDWRVLSLSFFQNNTQKRSVEQSPKQ